MIDLLQAAEKPKHSRERLLLVTAYAVSIYSNLVRTTKPFKDLQNSTYELMYPERGYRLLGEKVDCQKAIKQQSNCNRSHRDSSNVAASNVHAKTFLLRRTLAPDGSQRFFHGDKTELGR